MVLQSRSRLFAAGFIGVAIGAVLPHLVCFALPLLLAIGILPAWVDPQMLANARDLGISAYDYVAQLCSNFYN